MSPKFCHNCGKPAAAGWVACPFCETSFASLSEIPKSQKISPKIPQRPSHQQATVARVGAEDDEDDNYLDHQEHFIPQIEALAVEIQRPRINNIESIQQLATNPFSTVSTENRIAPPIVSAEETLKQFQQEAGNAPRQS
jgi:uncharacterized Zn finger protein (UPF0148 family)